MKALNEDESDKLYMPDPRAKSLGACMCFTAVLSAM